MNRKHSACVGIVLIAAFSYRTAPAASGQDAFPDLDTSSSEMRSLIERLSADRGNLLRYYNVAGSEGRRDRLKRFYADARAALDAKNFDAMSQDGKVDYVLFRNHLDH